MRLPFHISAESLLTTYREVRNLMANDETIIFEAMVSITKGTRNAFAMPSGPNEFVQKHDEIEKILQFGKVLKGVNTSMRLMEDIFERIKPLGGIGKYSTNDLLDAMVFSTSTPNVVIFLTNDMHWAAGWPVELHVPGKQAQRRVFVNVHDKNWGEVVPSYLVRYIHCAIRAYQEGMSAVAVALLSIAVEATLRDVLITKGYVFDHNASSVDIFEYTVAKVSTLGNAYTLTFNQPMPMNPSAFATTFTGQSVEVQIKRSINFRHQKRRVDLLIRTPPDLVDYWSLNKVQQPASQRVNGLGEALDIARNKESFLSAKDLPLDFDDVLKTMRNNLIHLSGATLNTHLPMFDESGSTRKFTLEDFLNDAELVYDFVTNIPDFITKQYNDLRMAGHTI